MLLSHFFVHKFLFLLSMVLRKMDDCANWSLECINFSFTTKLFVASFVTNEGHNLVLRFTLLSILFLYLWQQFVKPIKVKSLKSTYMKERKKLFLCQFITNIGSERQFLTQKSNKLFRKCYTGCILTTFKIAILNFNCKKYAINFLGEVPN